MISIDWDLPFDVAGMRTVIFDLTDLDNIEEAKTELGKQVDSIERGEAALDTPISVALDLQSLRSSENALANAVSEIQGTLSELVSEVRNRLPTPASRYSALERALVASPAQSVTRLTSQLAEQDRRELVRQFAQLAGERLAEQQRSEQERPQANGPTGDDEPEAKPPG